MGRFEEFIYEMRKDDRHDTDPDIAFAMWDKIKVDCKPYMKEVKKSRGEVLWRGVDYQHADMVKKSPRPDRAPRFIHRDLHSWLDKELKDLYGWKPRTEGVFTGGYHTAATYGDPMIVFPIGKFKYLAMEYEWQMDLYNMYDRYGFKTDEEEKEKVKDNIYEIINWYSTKNLYKYMKEDRFEVIVKCKQYYSVDGKWFRDFRKIWRDTGYG